MQPSHMRFQVIEEIGHLTVDRPEQRNAMTWAMYERLVDICNAVDGDDRVKLLMISGSGERAFISGTDIAQFRAFRGDPRAGVEYEERIDAVLDRLETVRKPTLAVIRGFAVGGGLEIALSCDIRIAADTARFGIPIARLGNCLSMKGYCRLVALIGAARASEMLYTARLIEAHEARSWGLVSGVLPATELADRAWDLAKGIAAAPPITLRVTKEAIRRAVLRLRPENPGHDLLCSCYNSADFQEGVAAFLEKRPPRWTGR